MTSVDWSFEKKLQEFNNGQKMEKIKFIIDSTQKCHITVLEKKFLYEFSQITPNFLFLFRVTTFEVFVLHFRFRLLSNRRFVRQILLRRNRIQLLEVLMKLFRRFLLLHLIKLWLLVIMKIRLSLRL